MKRYAEYQAAVEAQLTAQMTSLGEIPDRLREAMRYSLEAGGKRVRPVLLLACCDLLGGDVDEAMPFACALEMIHTYSLIHDDLPAMDDDDLRRGKPTSHRVFGEALAILAGDGLLSAAAELMLRASIRMDSLRGAKAAEAILRRAGVTGMVAGQTVDVTEEGTEPTRERVTYIHRHKTADLFAAPMEAGALLACATQEQLAAAVRYGEHLGLAFQITDDLLDLEGNPEELGKNTGVDEQHGKLTWVAVRGTAGSRLDAEAEASAACCEIRKLGKDASFFEELAGQYNQRRK